MNPRATVQNSHKLIRLLFIVALMFANTVLAQDDPAPTVERLVITGTDSGSLPSVELRLYGRDGQGVPIDFAQETLSIQHNGEPVGQVAHQGSHQVGTFTLFLIDIPPGVSAQLPALQEALTQFASSDNMTEQVDSMAIYQVGASGATELLEPTNFHNSVRNLFATPLTPETGATALIDSTVGLLEQMPTLRPNSEMAMSIVLLTDGTDSVSTRFLREDVVQTAVSLNIPIHTIWLNNENLGAGSEGIDFLADIAAGSGGIAVRMENSDDLPLIWSRIGGFRDHARIRYTVSALEAGEFPVTVSLVDNEAIRAETAVSIPNNIPSIIFNLPAESRTLSLPSLDDPITLRFNTSLSWLDGEERTLEAAQLIVNGETTADIPVEDIDQFDVAIDKLTYGNNRVEVVILDSQGIRARTPEILLTVNEGSRDVPDELDAGFSFGGNISRILLVVTILIIVVIMWFGAWKSGILRKLVTTMPRGRSREPKVIITDDAATSTTRSTAPKGYFEVIEAVTQLSTPIQLQGTTVRLGRSPAQSDIAFEQDVTMSRRHATLMLEGNHYRLFDNNSTSGTWVNNNQVPEYGVQLNDGDELFLGAVHLRFRQQ